MNKKYMLPVPPQVDLIYENATGDTVKVLVKHLDGWNCEVDLSDPEAKYLQSVGVNIAEVGDAARKGQ